MDRTRGTALVHSVWKSRIHLAPGVDTGTAAGQRDADRQGASPSMRTAKLHRNMNGVGYDSGQ